MGTTAMFLVLATFLASAVEAVEALTIVLALGVTRGWPSVRLGILAAAGALAALVAILGPALGMIPIDALRLVVGAFLLVFGLQWLRKAILRASGFKALHDEDRAYRQQVHDAMAAGEAPRAGVDWYSFVVSFKGVFLEGVEVVFIVLTFGSAHGSLPLAIGGAAVAVAVVGGAGFLVHEPLTRVPENLMKFAVGLMLTTFGIFWAGEGVGVDWPGSDAAILAILAFMTLFSLLHVRWLSRTRAKRLIVAGTGGAGGQ
ncbi:MAG TPA: hypothetical protein VJT33_05085 [bacterium]|nr:hypothetical protein [bacterium]